MPKITIFNPRGEKEAEGEVPVGTTLLEASLKLGAHHGSACGGRLRLLDLPLLGEEKASSR